MPPVSEAQKPVRYGGMCSVFGCKNYTRNGRSLFRFPKDELICEKWIHFAGRSDLDLVLKNKGIAYFNKIYRMCSDHFCQKDFMNPNALSSGLIPGSIPSRCLPGNRISTSTNEHTPETGPNTVRRSNDPAATPANDSVYDDDDDSAETVEIPITSVASEPIAAQPPHERSISVPGDPSSFTRLTGDRFPSVKISDRRAAIVVQKSKEDVLKGKCKIVQRKLRAAQKNISRYKRVIEKLRCRLKGYSRPKPKFRSDTCDATKTREGNNAAPLLGQLRTGDKANNGNRYTDTEQAFAVALYKCSPKSYRFLRRHFCLPSPRSLQRWLQSLDNSVTSSIVETETLNLIEMISKNMETGIISS